LLLAERRKKREDDIKEEEQKPPTFPAFDSFPLDPREYFCQKRRRFKKYPHPHRS